MKANNGTISWAITLALALVAVVPSAIAKDAPEVVQIAGTIEERIVAAALTPHGIVATSFDTVSGDLAGTGILHIHSTEAIGDNQLNVISTRRISTSQGVLVLSEVGNRIGDDVTVLSTVTGGTGIYKGASGQLALVGVRTPAGVSFVYTGIIILAE